MTLLILPRILTSQLHSSDIDFVYQLLLPQQAAKNKPLGMFQLGSESYNQYYS